LFALLAMGLKTIAISLAGFFLGGSVLLSLATAFGIERGIFVLYVIGGVLGVIFINAFFDWALIVISSLAGASMIARTLDSNRPIAGLIFLLLLGIGIAFQANDMQKDKKHHD
jgi:arginine exporter protein ArgO